MALPTCGASPRYLENLRIGGGYASSPDGGADIDHQGRAAFDGDVTIDGTLAANGPIAYKDILRADVAHGGVNRDWSIELKLFGDEASSSAGGPTGVPFSSRMFFRAWDFPAASIEALNTSFMLPPDYDGSPLNVRLVWTSQAALGGSSGDVLWRVYMRAFADGDAYNVPNNPSDAVDSFLGVDTIHIVDITHTPEHPGQGLPMAINLRRIGSDTLDTFNAEAQLLKVQISYA